MAETNIKSLTPQEAVLKAKNSFMYNYKQLLSLRMYSYQQIRKEKS